MTSEVESKNILNVLKKITIAKDRNYQFKQYEEYIVKQAIQLAKSSNGNGNSSYRTNTSTNGSSGNGAFGSDDSSATKQDKLAVALANQIGSLKELLTLDHGYCWTTSLISWSLNCIQRITGLNNNNDISMVISRNLNFPLIKPLVDLFCECLSSIPENKDPGYADMIMEYFFAYILDFNNAMITSVHWVIYYLITQNPEEILPRIHKYLINSCQNTGFTVLSNVLYSQSGNDKNFNFIKSVIEYCYMKYPQHVVKSIIELISIYYQALESNLALPMIDVWKHYIISYIFTLFISIPQMIEVTISAIFEKYGNNLIIKMCMSEDITNFSKAIFPNRIIEPFNKLCEPLLLKLLNDNTLNYPINKFLYLWFNYFEMLYYSLTSLTNELEINENQFYELKTNLHKTFNTMLIKLINMMYHSVMLQKKSIMSSFSIHVNDISELLVKRAKESFTENSNIEIILSVLELCGTNFGERCSIEILCHAIKYLPFEMVQLESNTLEEGEELESESDNNYLSYIKIIWKLKIAFELQCSNIFRKCIENIFDELLTMSEKEIKLLFQRFNLLLEVNDYLPITHQENYKNVFSNSNQWKQIYQYINHENINIVIQSYKLLSKCMPNNILPCEKFQICNMLITNYFNLLRKRILINLSLLDQDHLNKNELIQLFCSIKECLSRLLENSTYIGPILDILFIEIFCEAEINPLNDGVDLAKLKVYVNDFEYNKKIKKKENHEFSLYETNLIMCEQSSISSSSLSNVSDQGGQDLNRNHDQRSLATPLSGIKRKLERQNYSNALKRMNKENNSSFSNLTLLQNKKEELKKIEEEKKLIQESIKWNEFDVCSLILLCFKASTNSDKRNRNIIFFTKQFVKSISFIPPSIQQYDDHLPKALISFDKDIQLNRIVQKNPFIWNILELICKESIVNNYIYDVVRSLLASFIWFWNSPIRRKPNDFPKELKNTIRLMNILRNSKWIPVPLGLAGMIFKDIQGKDICDILLKVWELLKKSQPQIPSNQKTYDILKEESYKSSEIIRQILRRDINKFKEYYPIFYKIKN